MARKLDMFVVLLPPSFRTCQPNGPLTTDSVGERVELFNDNRRIEAANENQKKSSSQSQLCLG